MAAAIAAGFAVRNLGHAAGPHFGTVRASRRAVVLPSGEDLAAGGAEGGHEGSDGFAPPHGQHHAGRRRRIGTPDRYVAGLGGCVDPGTRDVPVDVVLA